MMIGFRSVQEPPQTFQRRIGAKGGGISDDVARLHARVRHIEIKQTAVVHQGLGEAVTALFA